MKIIPIYRDIFKPKQKKELTTSMISKNDKYINKASKEKKMRRNKN